MSLICKIKKDFGSFMLDVDLDAGDGVLALLGASGCGKSMTLKCIAGIVKPDSGYIEVNGRVLFDSEKHINLPPQQRKVGLLFQDYALFPNMTVWQNIRCGTVHMDKTQRNGIIAEMIRMFRLEGLEKRLPSELSGGQKQRVALARILAGQPDILMLDEPFSALDSYLRWQVEQEVAAVMREFGKTVLLVSHNRDEVYRLCDQIAVINRGKAEPITEKWKLFHEPRTYNAALLTGCKNISPVRPLADGSVGTVWGMTITNPPLGTKYIGIRAHELEPGFLKRPGVEYLCFPYTIVGEIEDTFEDILLLSINGGEQPLRWEISKSLREQIREKPPEICIEKSRLLYLDD